MPVDVLLVEDAKTNQGTVARMIPRLGDFRVVATVPTEAEALAWLEQNRDAWGLAVIDLVLDQGSGMSVIRRCRDTGPEAKVVVFSNFVSPGIHSHCLKLGADAAFDKSSDLEAFAAWCAAIAPLPGNQASA